MDDARGRGAHASWTGTSRQQSQREACLLRDDAIAEHLQRLGAAQAVAGDVALGQAHHPLDERRAQPVASVVLNSGGWGWSCESLPPSDGGLVLAPLRGRSTICGSITKAIAFSIFLDFQAP